MNYYEITIELIDNKILQKNYYVNKMKSKKSNKI